MNKMDDLSIAYEEPNPVIAVTQFSPTAPDEMYVAMGHFVKLMSVFKDGEDFPICHINAFSGC